MENLSNHFGENLKRVMQAKRIKVKDLSKQVDLSESRIYDLQKQSSFRPSVAKKLAYALGVDPIEFSREASLATEGMDITELKLENARLQKKVSELTETVTQLVRMLGKLTGFNVPAGHA